MTTKLQKIKWDLFQKKYKFLLLYGLSKGLVIPYSDELIEKLRKVSYGGIPASVVLLSNAMTNGHCYDRALLMARAFLEDEGDVKLLYGDIDSIKYNPKFISESPSYADHCFVERTTKDGRKFILDTSGGFVIDKDFYWKMEKPKIRHVNDKAAIKKFVEEDEAICPTDIDRDKFSSLLILPLLETTFGRPTEMYSVKGIELLQREIEHYKKRINYDDVCREVDEHKRRLGIKK